MAIIHQAEISPSKIEMISGWLAIQAWFTDDTVGLHPVGSFRFDDPAGTVGVETHLVKTASGLLVQVPLTYREAALVGADEFFLGNMEHTVLGTRWVYDGCGDPVYATTLAATIFNGDTEVEEFIQTDDGPVRRTARVSVRGTGVPDEDFDTIFVDVTCHRDGDRAIVGAPGVELVVFGIVDPSRADTPLDGLASLVGSWPGRAEPALLATARRT